MDNTNRVVTWKDYVDTRFEAQQKAHDLSRQALEIRLEAMNGFRAQLRDQAGSFLIRAEHGLTQVKNDHEIAILREFAAESRGKASQGALIFVGALSVLSLLATIVQIVLQFKH